MPILYLNVFSYINFMVYIKLIIKNINKYIKSHFSPKKNVIHVTSRESTCTYFQSYSYAIVRISDDSAFG